MANHANIPPKRKLEKVKIDRIKEKEERMEKMMYVLDRELEIKDFQLQSSCDWGDGIHQRISLAVLQSFPNSYSRTKGVWKAETTHPEITNPLTTDWDSKEIPTNMCSL